MLREIPPPLGLGGGNGSLRTRIGSTDQRAANGHGGPVTVSRKQKRTRTTGTRAVAAGPVPCSWCTSSNHSTSHWTREAARAVPADGGAGSPGVRVRAPRARGGADALEHAVRRAFPDLWEPIPDEMSWAALMCVVRVQRHWRARAAARAARQEAAGFGGQGGERPSASLGRRRPHYPVPSRRVSRAAAVARGASSRRSPARAERAARSRTAAGLGAEASAAAAGTKPEPAPWKRLTAVRFSRMSRPRRALSSFSFSSSASAQAAGEPHAGNLRAARQAASSKAFSGAPSYGGGSLRRGKVAPAPAETIEP